VVGLTSGSTGYIRDYIVRLDARPALFAILLCASGPETARAQAYAENRPLKPSFWHAAAGVAAVNFITWGYDWYVQRWPWANVGTVAWGHNLRKGFVWDNDLFLDNNLAHPYHGSFYHSSARSSGFGFFGSLPFVVAGSATWELFGENIPASLNDFITTTLGGSAIGEVMYRLSSLLGSKRAPGPTVVARELGALALSPIGRTQSLVSPGRDGIVQPTEAVSSLSLGSRFGHPFFDLAVRYGSPFSGGTLRPYDAFRFRVQVSPQPGVRGIREVAISGLLARKRLEESAGSQTVLGLFQHYDYDDLSAFDVMGHSVSGALLYQRRVGLRNRLELGAHLEGVLFGGVTSDYGFEIRRDYDLGSGAGARLNAAFMRDGHEWLRVESRLMWLHSLHGSDGNHLVTIVRAAAALPLLGPVGLGGDLAVATRHSSYPHAPSATRRVPEMRAYLTWSP
jgi:hypothetical protein